MADDIEMLGALLKKLELLITGQVGPTGSRPPSGTYISFCAPGISIGSEDLDFGFLAQSQGNFDTAADFASLVNTIPPVSGRFMPSDVKLNDVYKMVMRDSVLPQVSLSDDEKQAMKDAWDILFNETKIIDAPTGGVKQSIVDSPLYEKYKELAGIYDFAALEYKSVQLDAMFSTDPKAKAKWAVLGPAMEKSLIRLYDNYKAVGVVIEKALATREAIGGRGPELYWTELRKQMDIHEVQTESGQKYLMTKYFPSKFWDETHAKNWMTFRFAHDEVHTIEENSDIKAGLGGGFGGGLWSISGSGNYSEQRTYFKSDTSNAGLTTDLMLVPLRRTWFDPVILLNRAWDWDRNINNSVISDGGDPPTGLMPAYITGMIVAKNVKITVDMTSTENASFASQLSVSTSAGWGPFSVRGNYSRNYSRKTHDFVSTSSGIEIPGMQIIGFTCQTVPKTPNPDPDLNWIN